MSEDGSFREDLFYRISVIPIPCRRCANARRHSRTRHAFRQKILRPNGRKVSISEKAMQFLENYAWHGNVRELEHTIERAVALERTEKFSPNACPNTSPTTIRRASKPNSICRKRHQSHVSHLENLEKTYVVEALKKPAATRRAPPSLLQMPVRSLRHLLDKHASARFQRKCEAASKSGYTFAVYSDCTLLSQPLPAGY
jgi:transcriptional regulator with GAF, ATPase, and Fis domain